MRLSLRPFGLVLAFMLVLTVGMLAVQAQDDTTEEPGSDLITQIDYYVVVNDAEGQPMALVTFIEEDGYGTTAVLIQARNLTPGWHSVSLTSNGQCDPGDNFASAGDIYNPDEETYPNRGGDIAMVYAMQDGTAALSYRTDQFSLTDALNVGVVNLVVTEGFGDETTAGNRIACGGVTQGEAPDDVFFYDTTTEDLDTNTDDADFGETDDTDVDAIEPIISPTPGA